VNVSSASVASKPNDLADKRRGFWRSQYAVKRERKWEMVFGMQAVQDGPHQATVSKLAATGNQ
jgi:hypothetical protein